METAAPKHSSAGSWRGVTLALVLLVFLPLVPPYRLLVPVEQTPLVLVPIIAVCALVGWLGGGRPMLAVIWIVLAAWFLALPVGSAGSPYDRMARGWALLLAGSFGLVSLWNSAAPFFVRALGAVSLAIGTGFLLAIASPGGVDRYERVAASEFARRSNESIADLRTRAQTKEWRELAARHPVWDNAIDSAEGSLRAMAPRSAILLPALIALESLACLGLGWALYQRLSGGGIGPPLSPLKEFRFNDQLIWGVAVGGTMLLLPPFEEGRNAGLNLLVFFGAIYFIRGMGVVAWVARRQKLLVVPLVVAFIAALVIPAVAMLLQVVALATLGVGLGDTWLDWRRGAKPA